MRRNSAGSAVRIHPVQSLALETGGAKVELGTKWLAFSVLIVFTRGGGWFSGLRRAMRLSRRDCMKVAWHEMPGRLGDTNRPRGNGMVSGARVQIVHAKRGAAATDHTVP